MAKRKNRRRAVTHLFARVRCADGTEPPCDAAQLQYATHTSATPVGRGGRFIFTVNWTSPDQDVGDIVLTALAADGDLGTNNDVTVTTTATSLFAPSNSPELNAGGVVSAAALGSGVGGISPQSLISVFGLRLASPGEAVNVSQSDFDVEGLIPDELNRISLEFTTVDDPRVRSARVIFVNEKRINAQVPDLPVGSDGAAEVMAQAVINRGRGANEIRSNVVTATAAGASPALFTLDSSGQGEAAAVAANGFVISSQGSIEMSRPALPGETILLCGTGFGPVENSLAAGELSLGPESPDVAGFRHDRRHAAAGFRFRLHWSGSELCRADSAQSQDPRGAPTGRP